MCFIISPLTPSVLVPSQSTMVRGSVTFPMVPSLLRECKSHVTRACSVENP
jgi:hypothetical protein